MSSWVLVRRLLDAFWLVPGFLAVSTAVLGVVLLELDRHLQLESVPLVFGGDAEAARVVLSTLAGSLITVAGLTFSITMVVLTLISSQYTPRAIPTFLSDRLNQVVAGLFVGIFAYCLIALGAVRSGSGSSSFVPSITVTVGLGLGLLALGLLVVFIHHMAENIQASNIVARIGERSLEALDRARAEPFDPVEDVDAYQVLERWREHGEPSVVTADLAGYVQRIDLDRLAECIPIKPVYIHVPVAPGDFVTPESALAEIWPGDSLHDGTADRVRQRFTIANGRDLRQDASYGLRQLADVAVKALSPSVNDPTTAVEALGRAGAALESLAARRFPPAVRASASAGAILVVARDDFENYLETALGEVAHYAADNPRVVVAILELLSRVADVARRADALDRLAAIESLADHVAEHARAAATSERDRARIDDAMLRFGATLP